MVRLPIRIAWLLTGNNLTFSRELARRTVWIRVDAKTPAPHLRRGFRHDPLQAWVRTNRGKLVGAALVLVQNWIARGRPPFTKHRLGSFEAWAAVVGGIVDAAGIGGFLENLKNFSAHADTETGEWLRFVSAWWDKFGESGIDTGALFQFAEATMPEVLGDGTERSQKTRLGKAIAKRAAWRFAIGDGAAHRVLRLDEAEVIDDFGRRRNGWALKYEEPTDVGNVGTLGGTLGTAENTDESSVPNVGSVGLQHPNVTPALSLHPVPCAWCGGRRFWRSKAGLVVCGTCHPPATRDLVAEWLEAPEST
jgi:hypothetical protein